MLEVVSMFPDIDTDNRRYSLAEGRILACCARYHESTLIQAQPCPSRSEYAESFGSKCLLERFKTPESSIYSFREFPFGISATIWSEDGPEKAMVDMTTEIIDNTLFLFCWNFFKVLEKNFLWWVFFDESRTFKEFRIVGDIGLMMLAMMYFHRLSVNMWLKGIIWIRKLRKRVVHSIKSEK